MEKMEPDLPKCKWCDKVMVGSDSCVERSVEFPDGTKLPQSTYHFDEPSGHCHDCGIKHGGFHHPGCDVERCPRCNGQLIGCGCLDEEDRMLEQLTPDPITRIVELHREWLDGEPDKGALAWIMQKSKGTVPPRRVEAYAKGWERFQLKRDRPGLNEDDDLRRGYNHAEFHYVET